MVSLKIIAAVAVIAFVAGWAVSDWRSSAKHLRYVSEQSQAMQNLERKARDAEAKSREKIAQLDADLEAARQETRTVTETIEKEVIRYVQSDTPKCRLDRDWVRLHNAATGLPRNSEAAGQPDDATKGAGADTALETVTRNYRTCMAEYDKLRGLQDYVRTIHDTR